MATANTKTNVLHDKTSNALPLLLLLMAFLQGVMALLMVSVSGDSTTPTLYAGGMTLLAALGLNRDTLPPALRLGVVKLAGVVLLSIPALALLGAALHLDLLTLPHVVAAPLLLLVAALVKPD